MIRMSSSSVGAAPCNLKCVSVAHSSEFIEMGQEWNSSCRMLKKSQRF
jgi:hypothetical protein